jgi:outer membrane protein with beta-barrel domain
MRLSVIFGGVVAGLVITHSLAAQAPLSGKSVALTPYAGYLVTGDLLKGPVGTSLSMSSGAMYGAQLGMKIAPNMSLVGNIGYSAGNIRVGVPFLGGVDVGSSSTLLYDGGLEFQFPTTSASSLAFSPFVQVGAGAMRYQIDASILHTNATNFAANAGIGADMTLGTNMGLRLMAKDYIGKFNFKEATTLDIQGQTAHNWALSAGIRLDF